MRLVADIGGTNARFALAVPETGELTEVQVLPVSEFADFPAALGAYLGSGREISAAAIAAAGPRDGDAISLTNAPWQIVAEDVSKVLGGAKVRLLNDLEAVALAIPHLGAEEAEAIAHCPPPKQASPMIAVNIGTGFGAAVTVPTEGGWIALGTEAGHMSLIPATPGEDALMRNVRTAEDAFSGPGYIRLFDVRMREGGEAIHPVLDEVVGEQRQLYSRMFGRFVGDLVLATGAWGGVWFSGGVVSDFHRVFDQDAFLRAFRRKGPMAARMERVPVFRIMMDAPAFKTLAGMPIT
ncbi:MAG TPA: glucokinase [Paracoccaceae bacterium]|nr:glucokinase [Paracoccaceae bacterium]